LRVEAILRGQFPFLVATLGKLAGNKFADLLKLAVPIDPGTRPPWSDHTGIGPSMKRKDPIVDPGGEMHGTAVDADRSSCLAEEGDQFAEIRPVEQIVNLPRPVMPFVRGVFGSAYENDRLGSEGFAEFFHFRKRETFSCSSRKRVQDDGGVGELLGEIDWSSFWERKLDRLCRDAEGLHERPIAIDGMTMGPVLHADRVVIQVGRSFSRLGEADALPGTGHLGEECAAEEALEVEREIIVL
jgi:hypothetical protein